MDQGVVVLLMASSVFKRYVVLVLAVGCLLQPLLAFVYWKLLEPYLTWTYHRIVEVTGFPPLIRRSLVDAYIKNTLTKETKPLVLVMGDSEPYGLDIEDNLIFSHLLAQRLPDYAVFNLSFIDGRFADMEKVIDSLKRYNVHPEFVIFDIDVTHFKSPGDMHGHDRNVVLTSTFVPLWAAVAAATLPNVRSVSLLKDKQPDIRPDTFNYVPLREDYLPHGPSPAFEESLKHLLSHLKTVGKHIVPYMAPFAVESFRYYGFDDIAFQRLTAHYSGICQDLGMDCLDLSGALPIDDFIDIIHLNRQGHAFMAQRLEQEIAKQPGEASRAATTNQPGRKTAEVTAQSLLTSNKITGATVQTHIQKNQ